MAGPRKPRASRARSTTLHEARGERPLPVLPAAIEKQAVAERVEAIAIEQASTMRDILADFSPGDATTLLKGLLDEQRARTQAMREAKDDELRPDWRAGGYPYVHRLSRRYYEREKYRLQVELLKFQQWVRKSGQKLVILFEGRDAAGKGGTIKRFMEHLNPRAARVVALTKPTETEQGQWYFHRYVAHLPTAGEIVLFDRSWYNRAGVEKVMGFCTTEEYSQFLRHAPLFEEMLVESGFSLTKLWFSVTQQEQRTRFAIRQIDPVRRWKLSPTDIDSLDRWDDYTEAKEAM